MIRRALAATLVLAGCAAADPSLLPASRVPSATTLRCGEVASATCREVAAAAELMLGTSPVVVEELELPEHEDGLEMAERYLVRLEPDAAGDELVEVVRFVGSDSWSVRRPPPPSGGN